MKNIIPIMLAISLTNMSCGKSKKEEPVTIEQENQNIDQPQANEPENQKREVGVITTEFGDLIVEFFEDSCLLYTSPSPRDMRRSRMPSSA